MLFTKPGPGQTCSENRNNGVLASYCRQRHELGPHHRGALREGPHDRESFADLRRDRRRQDLAAVCVPASDTHQHHLTSPASPLVPALSCSCAAALPASPSLAWLRYTSYADARDDKEIFVTSSPDGATWTASTNLTTELKPNPDPSAWVATGPPGGVQLPSGRLVTAAYYNRPDKQTRAFAVLSDTHGATWRRGADVGIDQTPGHQVWGGGESQVVPFGGGDGLAMLIRGRTLETETLETLEVEGSGSRRVDDVSHNHALTFSSDVSVTTSCVLAEPHRLVCLGFETH
jgi:hypothetical protein